MALRTTNQLIISHADQITPPIVFLRGSGMQLSQNCPFPRYERLVSKINQIPRRAQTKIQCPTPPMQSLYITLFPKNPQPSANPVAD